jgi:aminoglycoside phosphotransferase (APT) family kinase protein
MGSITHFNRRSRDWGFSSEHDRALKHTAKIKSRFRVSIGLSNKWTRNINGDLQSGNLLVAHGRLSAVIDFGYLGVGDPACDVMAAWMFLSAETRDVFRAALQVDEATWARGRGWALSVGLIALPYYQDTNPVLAGIARRAIREALADHSASG